MCSSEHVHVPNSVSSSLLQLSPHHRYLHSFPTRRSSDLSWTRTCTTRRCGRSAPWACRCWTGWTSAPSRRRSTWDADRSEEHTSELQSRGHLVCRLLLEKKNARRRKTSP